MRLKYKEKLNDLITNKVDLGTITYTNKKIFDSHVETNLHDVYTRPSIYKQNAMNQVELENYNQEHYKTFINLK